MPRGASKILCHPLQELVAAHFLGVAVGAFPLVCRSLRSRGGKGRQLLPIAWVLQVVPTPLSAGPPGRGVGRGAGCCLLLGCCMRCLSPLPSEVPAWPSAPLSTESAGLLRRKEGRGRPAYGLVPAGNVATGDGKAGLWPGSCR